MSEQSDASCEGLGCGDMSTCTADCAMSTCCSVHSVSNVTNMGLVSSYRDIPHSHVLATVLITGRSDPLFRPPISAKIEPTKTINITAALSSTNIVRPNYPATDVWTFNGEVPGTTIRLRHGQTLKANVLNQLKVPTAVHWDGIRLPNAMDGVAGLTQEPICTG